MTIAGTAPRCMGEAYPVSACNEDAAATRALSLISSSLAVVKTVRNGDWLRLMHCMTHPPFRSSFSLLPPDGRMHLFGQSHVQCAGLLFDRRALATSTALCWPSGYFAKTEHHLHVEPDGSVRLTGGRSAHLVSLEALVEASQAAAARSVDEEPPLYNEISLQVEGLTGVAAVFVRGDSEADTLYAIGVRAMLQHLFPHLPLLPLLRLSPAQATRSISHEEQLQLLRAHTAARQRTRGAPVDASGMPRLPVDTRAYPELETFERLGLHAIHGIGRTSLHATFKTLADRDGTEQLAQHVTACLCAAALVDNVASAREIVRTAAPLILAPLLVDPNGRSSSRAAAARAKAIMEAVAKVEADTLGGDRSANAARGGPATTAGEASWALASVRSVRESIVTLRHACCEERSEGSLVALGAMIALSEFVAGGVAARLKHACAWLGEWCKRAEPGPCSPSAFAFLMSSWMEAKKVDGNSDWLSFLSGKAVANRLAFRDQLAVLLAAQQRGDGLAFVQQLYALSSRLRRPCLRLRLLQQVLGLDTRFNRDIVHGVICLAFDVLEEMGGGGGGSIGGAATGVSASASGGGSCEHAGAPLRRSPSGREVADIALSCQQDSRRGAALDLDGYDEATRLDADALLGPPAPERRPSDPVGEESRGHRLNYYYR